MQVGPKSNMPINGLIRFQWIRPLQYHNIIFYQSFPLLLGLLIFEECVVDVQTPLLLNPVEKSVILPTWRSILGEMILRWIQKVHGVLKLQFFCINSSNLRWLMTACVAVAHLFGYNFQVVCWPSFFWSVLKWSPFSRRPERGALFRFRVLFLSLDYSLAILLAIAPLVYTRWTYHDAVSVVFGSSVWLMKYIVQKVSMMYFVPLRISIFEEFFWINISFITQYRYSLLSEQKERLLTVRCKRREFRKGNFLKRGNFLSNPIYIYIYIKHKQVKVKMILLRSFFFYNFSLS